MKLGALLTVLVLVVLLSGCQDVEERQPAQYSHEEEITVSADGYVVKHYEKIEGYENVYLSVESDQPLDVWVMPSEEDVDIYLDEEGKYDLYQDLSRRNDDSYFASDEVNTDIYIIVENAGYATANAKLYVVQSMYKSRQ